MDKWPWLTIDTAMRPRDEAWPENGALTMGAVN